MSLHVTLAPKPNLQAMRQLLKKRKHKGDEGWDPGRDALEETAQSTKCEQSSSLLF